VNRVLYCVFSILFLCSLPLLGHSMPALVAADWVKQRLGDPEIILVDMSSGKGPYQGRFIPGAVQLPYSALVQRNGKGISLRVSDQRLHEVLGILGIDANRHVVIYDEMGGLHAGRLYWELERIGHTKVSVLDGGIVEWMRRGLPIERQPAKPQQATYQANGGGRENEADLHVVKKAMGDGKTVLLDVRSEHEYRGMQGQSRSGHIPGAQWWPWEQVLQAEKGLVAKDESTILASLEGIGVTTDMPVIAYCRSGHRASRTYLTLRRLGFENVKLYDGSMAEWSKDGSAPVKSGMKP